MPALALIILLWAGSWARSFALEPKPNALFMRVIDVGAGLCCVLALPGDHFLIYDAGNYEDLGGSAYRAVSKLIPKSKPIDLMILSHSDSDHLAAVPKLCARYRINEIIHGGKIRSTITCDKAYDAIAQETANQGCRERNLSKSPIEPGTKYQIGEVTVTIVCGFAEPLEEWNLSDEAEIHNAGSIVARVQYMGKSILLCGDTVGRHIGDSNTVCLAAEKFMVERAHDIPIVSEVMVAPHHGADNGSSLDFIRAVTPEYVIFSAGHKYQHPRAVAVKRYLDNQVLPINIFRTDRGDDEGEVEWDRGRIHHHTDQRGDDDVDVLIEQSGEIKVAYRRRNRRS